jgi:hypothetical protein
VIPKHPKSWQFRIVVTLSIITHDLQQIVFKSMSIISKMAIFQKRSVNPNLARSFAIGNVKI